jgi:ligand-binding sensor domain-containing protein
MNMYKTCILVFLFSGFTAFGQSNISLITDTAWANYTKSNSGLPDNFVSDIEFDKNGVAWVSTWGGGLVKMDGDNWTIYNKDNSGLPNNLINHMQFDGNGVLWLATDGDVAKFDGQSWNVLRLPADENIALTLEIDHNNVLWIGTYDQGLYRYDGKQLKKMWGGYKQMDFGVNDIVFDKNNILWMATRIGIFSYDGKTWKQYNKETSALKNDMFYQLSIDSKGRLWAATYPTGNFGVYENGQWTNYDEPLPDGMGKKEFPGNYIYAMIITEDDDILTGSQYHGALALYNGIEMEGIATPLSDEEMGVSSINVDPQGNIWVGSWKNGLFVLQNPDPDIRETLVDSLNNNLFLDRQLKKQKYLEVQNRKVELWVWDNKKEDGDIVSLSLNGEWILEDYTLKKAPLKMEIRLKKDIDNHLILYAKNLGKQPPNTAAIAVLDQKGNRNEFILKSDFRKSGTVVIRYKPLPTQ